jgi:hypothetical protein
MNDIPREKWELRVWPQGKPPRRDTYLFCRGYPSRDRLYRAAWQLHQRFPDAKIAVQHRVLEYVSWEERGEPQRLYWCSCDGRLEFLAGMWCCRSCEARWPDEKIRPEAQGKKGG